LEKQEKLYQELREVLGPEGKIIESSYPKLKYLKVENYNATNLDKQKKLYQELPEFLVHRARDHRGQLYQAEVPQGRKVTPLI
jgi:hypothetical protein